MKTSFLLLAFIFSLPCLAEHPFSVQYSSGFEEPRQGWNKILQLSNGRTFLFHFTLKEGIGISVYGKDRQLQNTLNITGAEWDAKKMASCTIEGLYEIDGRPVIFLQQLQNKQPILFRIQLDPEKGTVQEEAIIGRIEKYNPGSYWALRYGGVEAKDFYVEKDPYSDNYAVAAFNSFAGDAKERIDMQHFTVNQGRHELLSSCVFDAEGFKFFRFIGMTVDSAKRIFICVYGFNSRKEGGSGDSKVIVSRLEAGKSAFVHKELEFSEDFKNTTAVMQYNKSTNVIQLLTLTYLSSKSKFLSNTTTNSYEILLSYLDPETLFVLQSKPIYGEYLNSYLRRTIGSNTLYTGLPQQMILHRNNTTSLLLENLQKQTYYQNGAVARELTLLGDIGILELNEKGNEDAGYVIHKSQAASGSFPALYLSQKSKGMWSFRFGGLAGMSNNAFFSFDYIEGAQARYVLLNDYPENEDQEGKKRKTVSGISNTNTLCYTLKNGFVEKSYLFGTPGKNSSNFCYIEASDFNKKEKTFATLVIKREGKKKEACIAWINFP